MPMKSSGRSIPSASEVIGRVEVFEQSSASGSTTPAISANTFCLSSSLSNTASITRSHPARSFGSAVGVIRLRKASTSAADSRPFCTCLASSFSEYVLPFDGGLERHVLEHDLDAGLRAHVRDPGAHHPRAEHARPCAREYRGTSSGRDAPALIACRSKKNAWIMFFAICPVASETKYRGLDPRRGGEVDLAALDRGAHDRPRRRVRRALQLLAQVRREGRQERGQLRRGRRTAGDLVAVAVPRLLRVTVVRRDPPVGRVEQFVGRHHLVDDADDSGVRGLHPLTLQQHLHQRVLQAEHPDRAGHAATAGQQTERHLGYADLDPVVVGNDPVVTGERDLQPAAERRSVDRGNDRDAERLQRPGAAA